MERKTYKISRHIAKSIEKLPPEDGYYLSVAVAHFSLDGIEPDLSGASEIVWSLIIDELKKERANFINGCKGGRPKLNN